MTWNVVTDDVTDVDVSLEYYRAVASIESATGKPRLSWYSVLNIFHKVTIAIKHWLNDNDLYQICWYWTWIVGVIWICNRGPVFLRHSAVDWTLAWTRVDWKWMMDMKLVDQKWRVKLQEKEEAQLPQRNSMSAAHVYLGWLTDRAMHRTLQSRRGCIIFDIQTLWFRSAGPKRILT